jgi:hypothetical protein
LLATPVAAANENNQCSHFPSNVAQHFGLGVSAGPDDSWMAQSGVPWDYAYQYLAGGVNTGKGWRTWDDRGHFPVG